MNDPGLDEPIEEGADQLEDQIGDRGTHTEAEIRKPKTRSGWSKGNPRLFWSKCQMHRDRKEKERAKHMPSEDELTGGLWMYSTLFPLTAATLGPIANVMSICALVYPWRLYIPPGSNEGVGDRIEDPHWVIAINAISLAAGVGANAMLLLNLAKRISPTLAQPVTIALWYLAFTLLVILVILYVTVLRLLPRKSHAYSESFYYAIIAASLYFFIATLLTCNFAGALRGKYNRHFNLSVPQRTMMLQTMSLMTWLCLGAGVFSKLESWTFVDGIHFCNTTLLTIGMGDFALTTNAGRALLFPYAGIGVVMLGLIVGSIRGLVLERAKRKVKRRMLEKLRVEFLEDERASDRIWEESHDGERENDKKHFEIMRKVQALADRRRKWMSLGTSIVWVLVFWLLGAFVFTMSENRQDWTYFQSVYFTFTSLLTIGYGDFVPYSNSGKPFFVIWSILAIPAITIFISNLGDTVILGFKDLTLWVGEYTLLPEQRGRQRLDKKSRSEEAPRRVVEDKKGQASDDQAANDDTESLREAGERLVEEEQHEEQHEEQEEDRRSADAERERHKVLRLHHKLAMALQETLPDLNASPPKRYEYKQWRRYLDLIDEADAAGLRDAAKDKEGEEGEGSAESKGVAKRDWMEENSPLMAKGTEAEWLVKAIAVRLEGGLRRQIDGL